MTVSTVVNHEQYDGNGTTTTFPYRFRVLKSSHMVVTVVDTAGLVSTLQLGTDYDITGVGQVSGGNVILKSPLQDGWKISLDRDLPAVQETDLRNQGRFFAETHEDAFDYLTMLIQRLGSQFSLSLRKPTFIAPYYDALGNLIRNLADPVNPQDSATKNYVDSLAGGNLSKTLRTDNAIPSLPGIDQRKNKLVAMDDSGNPIMVLPASGSASDVMIELAKPTGASSIGYKFGTVSSALDKVFFKTDGFVSVLDFIPSNLHQYLKDYVQSSNIAGDLSSYLNQASKYCEDNHKDLIFPFGYYFISKTFYLPAACLVYGQGYPYILAIGNFESSNVMISCDKKGQPTYYFEGFNVNGNNNTNMIGLRIGGCRNSVFRKLIFTNCPAAGVEVYPTDPSSGDVENLELNHIWTVLSGGLHMRANGSISRGNITDAEVYNCQLTTGDATTVGTPALRLTGAPGKEFFGVKFDRVFTQTTDNDHIVITPNGGKIYGNTFSCFSGESWTIAAGGIANDFSKHAVYIFDGVFVSNAFRDFYGQGLPGNGLQLGIGSSGNTFDGMRFVDKNTVGYNNKWVYIPAGSLSNSFSNVFFDGSFNRADAGYGAVAANFIFRSNDGKIIDLSGSTLWNSAEIRNVVPVIVKRGNIFAINGNQLVNYPVDGCAFSTVSAGISVVVPAGSTPYFLTIPFIPTAGFSGKFIGLTIKYICGSMNGMTLSADICGSGSSMTDLTQNKLNVFSAYGAYNASNKTVTITFGGTRTAQANLELDDIVITEGAFIPYVPNYQKIYVES